MRKTWHNVIAAVLLTTGSLMAANQTDPQIVNIKQVDQVMLKGIMEGRFPNTTLQISAGEKLPLLFFLKGDFIDLENGCEPPLFIKAKQDMFLKNDAGKFSFKTATSEWKTLTEFIRGRAMIRLELDDSGEPFVQVGAELFEKQSP